MGASLGFTPGQVVQEFYYDEDVDQDLRRAVEKDIDGEMVDFDFNELVDGVIVWWRQDDADQEDLTDVLLDAAANLDDSGGTIWVLSPKPGRPSSVQVRDITEAAKVAGLKAASAISVGEDWAGMELIARPRTR